MSVSLHIFSGLTTCQGLCYSEDVLGFQRLSPSRCKAFFCAFFVSRFIIEGLVMLQSRTKLHRGCLVSRFHDTVVSWLVSWHHEFKRFKMLARMLFSPFF